MNAHAILTAIRELKKNDPSEFAVFQKDYAEEMTEGVEFWSANCGYITLWKLQEGVEVSGCELEGKERFGDEWGCLKGISTRTLTKKMVERGDFYEEEEENWCDCGCGLPSPCYIDDPKTVRRENAKAMVAYENKKAMKDYVKARLNHLMGLGQKQMMDDGGDGEVKCLFTRLEEWDGEEFDNIICSLCDKRDGELNATKSGYEFSVGAEITEKDDKVWEVSVSWSTLYDQNPFDDFYDEDEDNGSDSDDE